MTGRRLAVLFSASLLALPALAADPDPGGILNPEEMTLNRSLSRALEGDVDMVICAQGYLMTKKGAHDAARKIFQTCAERGWSGTMTWMAYMNQNGFGAAEDPQAAAEWDRRAAAAVDPVGEFNYGLDLLRGYGVNQDTELGRQYIDRSAEKGLDIAEDLKQQNYDWQAVTPDADEWKFQRIY
jgi:hypothetical protein